MDVLDAEYVEVATAPTTIPRLLSSEYVEVATVPTVVPHVLTTFYIEAVTPVPAPSIEGWGIPID